ncbi:MAG: amino acid ABC transporter permease [Caldilineaceae bacterium]|nr:amino acid ABC transporter permease [Caldilineaceae bacterium]
MAPAVQSSMRKAQPPPSERSTVLGWLHKNLFDGWLNSVLTIITLGLILALLRPFFNWALNTARWEVIPANINLIMRGQYPAEQAVRLWIVLILLAFVVGFAWAANTKLIQGELIVVFAIPLLLLLVPFFSGETRIYLLVMEAAALIGYGIGRFVPEKRSSLGVWALLAYAVVMLIILRGGSGETGIWAGVPTTLWGGLLLSLLLAVFGITISFPLGVLLALGRQSKLPAIRMVSVLYIEFIRGVPLISLLFMAQVMLQLFLPDGFPTIDRALRALAAITLFSAAYTAENVRGGLQSIPKGQYEAADAMGLSAFQSMTYIILPQALRAVIPVLVGQFISLFKDTSLVALVGLFDLLGIARSILGNPNWLGTHQEVYAFIGLLYWIFSYSMSYTSRRLETSLAVANR